ncbi:MAG TPA: beta-ketoacyl synthase N-terminal-like domain-containing protein [Streptosporangiaceae bacterium]|nr:beta-ketoacyl synthase N-terminal-like domain-containing protein [Streptosporangiaceae bacterium]
MIDITAWSAVSPYGMDATSFASAIRARRPAMRWADPAGPPGTVASLVPGFDQRAVLGRKGTKGMDRVTGLAITAVSALSRAPNRDTALVLGTTGGSVRSAMNLTRASLIAQRPYDVDPATIPSVVMNCAAGHCAIWHGITGPNTTIAGGRAAGLLCLAYARRLLRAGRASTVLCGAAEEYSAERSWLTRHDTRVVGEGAAMLRLESSHAGTAHPLATLLAVGATVPEVLERAGVRADEVWAVIAGSEAERDAVAPMFDAAALDRVPLIAELAGDTGAVSAVFGIAATLAVADGLPRFAVVTATDPCGATAAAVLLVNAAQA